MNNFIIYSIEIAISLALFYSAYWLFLKNETFFKLNRLYLLFSVVISLLVPLLNITLTTKAEASFITKYLVLPIEDYEQRFIGDDTHEKNRHQSEKIPFGNKGSKERLNVRPESKQAPVQTISSNTLARTDAVTKINWLTILLVVYIIGGSFFLVRFVANITWISRHALKHKPQQISGMKVIRFETNLSPFSFLNLVFISEKEYPEEELCKIIAHEKVHASQKHSLDLILFELLLILQWFNPFAWRFKQAIKINHEYLADQGTLNTGVDLPGYQYSLLSQVLRENNIELTSNYNTSIKKRITMMLRKRSTKKAALKLIIAFPIILLLFGAFAFRTASAKKQVNAFSENKLLISKDSVIKKIAVPVSYLKSLEGEYVSTGEKGRRIVFTELLGTLFGWDNGYTYKIIPIGGEKFINPDDKASLEFDSRNKEAVTLLLFGKLKLNKVKAVNGVVQNRSMALTLANKMLKDGITSALSFYKSAKDSTNYFLTEIDMSYAGFELMEAGKTKEAVALLKLDTEIFGSSYNAFDSYAEALLAHGDKPKAIDAFKESVRLNPGSKNGIKRLKELGINVEDVVKPVKIPIDELKILEGVYFSVDQPTWVRKITLKVIDGILTGEDNGYNYKLIAMGNGKFINPDDGASLIFDTKDKNNISFLIFGKTLMKKVKVSKEPPVSLKEYAGIYFPAKQDTILRPMEIVASENKLFRYIAAEPEVGNRTIDLEFITGNIFYYTDKSGRSIEFIVNDKNQVTGCMLKRWDGVFVLTKKK